MKNATSKNVFKVNYMNQGEYGSLEEIDARLTAIKSEISVLEGERTELDAKRVSFVKNLATINRISARDCDDFAMAVAAAVELALREKRLEQVQPTRKTPARTDKKEKLQEGCYSYPGVKDYLYFDNKRGPRPAHAVPQNRRDFTPEQLAEVEKEKMGTAKVRL